MDASSASQDSQIQREDTPTGHPNVDGQAASGGHPDDSGAYYEPQFSPRSHGFRPRRGCHTALREVYRTWNGTAWFIEGDISQCFDSLDHQVLLSILRETIHDNRFIRLIENLLTAGYLADWKFTATLSG